jgi:superfamily II DNA or RNA helicase
VDGLYQTGAGELCAYQVKYRSRRPALTWEELSTFMGLTDQVSQRVLFTNCEALPNLMRDRSGFIAVRGSDLDRLTSEDFAAMRQWLRSGQVALPRKQPRPHQQEALNAIAGSFNEGDRATVVMACGTGKSLVALWAAEQRDCRSLLVLVPSLALLRQLLHEWLRETRWENFAYLCVCSDPTVAKGVDDFFVHQADLDFPVSTDSAAVQRFLAQPFGGIKVVFSTYQSAHVVAEGLPTDATGTRTSFDLGIFDEAHKTASRTGTQFSFALEDANLPIVKRLFFTATPRHYDIRKKDKEGDVELVYSMDKPEIYGPVAHTLSFAEAAKRGIICDYKVVISVVTSDMVNDHLLSHGEVLVAGDMVKARQVALQIALQKAVEKYGVSRIFTFHGTVAAARSFTSDDSDGIRQHLTDFRTLHVSGAMPTAAREDQMKAFRQADKAVISNARCLTEGVDVPAVDMVAFISPRKSKVDIVQATGRAMRKSPGKEFGYVMVPLFLEQAANETIEEALHRTGYDDIWELLAAMREQDDVLTDIIREMRVEKGKTGGYDESRFRERVEVVGPSLSLEEIRGAITAECLDSIGVSWDERFGELLTYKSIHGDTNVPLRYETNLGTWVVNQRMIRKSGILSAERIRRLDNIGFVWDTLESRWEAMFAELINYNAQHGHINIPVNVSTSLGNWVSNQRKNLKSGELDSYRKKQLDEIGFVWDVRDEKWEEMFNELLLYKAEHGNLNVPINYHTGLGTWVSIQRRNLKLGSLEIDKRRRLDEVGFDWEPINSNWDAMFNELLEYKSTFGHVNIPQRPTTPLGRWVRGQRDSMRVGRITQYQKDKLEQIGFEFDMLSTKWDSMLNELIDYKETYGNTNVPTDWPTYLGTWVSLQRKSFANGKLEQDRKAKLEEIDFTWNALDFQWEERFCELVAYMADHGDCDVPSKWPSGLGTWVSNQRTLIKKGTLSHEKIVRLEGVGFLLDSFDAKWETRFKELLAYKYHHEDTNVPQNWPTNLGRWVATQRKLYNEEKLPLERKNRLEKIGFMWRINNKRDTK